VSRTSTGSDGNILPATSSTPGNIPTTPAAPTAGNIPTPIAASGPVLDAWPTPAKASEQIQRTMLRTEGVMRSPQPPCVVITSTPARKLLHEALDLLRIPGLVLLLFTQEHVFKFKMELVSLKFTPMPPYSTSTVSEPCNVQEALSNANRKHAMDNEFNSLMQNRMWHLVPPQHGNNIIDCK
jgi:hypothetical protein